MTDDRDPTLQALFAHAEQDLPADAFTNRVMSQIETLSQRARIGWILAALALVLCAWLLATQLQATVYLLTQSLTHSLIDLDGHWLTQTFLPVNNVASLCALAVMTLRFAYRKIF